MVKFKFKDVLKYTILKAILTSVFVVITNSFNKEGSQQMIGFAIIVGIISLGVFYLLLLATRKIASGIIYYSFLLIIFAFILNELMGMAIEIDTNIYTVIARGKPWQVTYKICDVISVVFSSYVCLVLPARNIFLKDKSI